MEILLWIYFIVIGVAPIASLVTLMIIERD
jgi:hypothetical protein